MTLSSSNLNEIGNLYESIAASEQEQLNEIGGIGGQKALDAVNARLAQQKQSDSKLDAQRAQRFGRVNPVVKAAKGGVQGTLDKTTGKWTANSATPRPAAAPTRPAAAPTRPAAGAPAKPASSAVTPAKTLPSKPTIGTTAGGTKFERRTPTRQEMDAAKGAGGGEAGVKAAVAASKPAATSTLSAATAAASKTPAFKPATASQATSAAPSTSAAASGGNAVSATNAIAAAPKPKPMVPTRMPLAQSFEYDVYDLVLEYLLDNGHVDTVEEANYVMMEMDAETIGNIVEDSATLSASARKRAEEMGRKRRSTKEYKQGLNRGTGRNERAAYNLSNMQRTAAANPDTQRTSSRKPSTEDTGMHKGDYGRYNRSKPEKNPKHNENK